MPPMMTNPAAMNRLIDSVFFQVNALGVPYYTRLARLILGPFKLANQILELCIIFLIMQPSIKPSSIVRDWQICELNGAFMAGTLDP